MMSLLMYFTNALEWFNNSSVPLNYCGVCVCVCVCVQKTY